MLFFQRLEELMKINIDILKKSPLFMGIEQEEIEKIMPVLESKMKV